MGSHTNPTLTAWFLNKHTRFHVKRVRESRDGTGKSLKINTDSVGIGEARADNRSPGMKVEDEDRMSLVTKLTMSSALMGSDAMIGFQQLYSVPVLQILGVSLQMLYSPVMISGGINIFLLLWLGWISDRGSTPTRRKTILIVYSSFLLIAGAACIMIAYLHSPRILGLESTRDEEILSVYKWVQLHLSVSNTTLQPTFNANSSGQLTLSASENSSSENNSTVLVEEWITFCKTIFSETGKKTFNETVLSSLCTSPASAEEASKTLRMTDTVASSGQNDGNHTTHVSNTDDPLSDGASLCIFLGMLGVGLLDAGYDCTNLFVRSWLLICSPLKEHRSLLSSGLVIASAGAILTFILANVRVNGRTEGETLAIHVCINGGAAILFTLIGTFLTLLMGYLRLRHNMNKVNNNVTITINTDDNKRKSGSTLAQQSSGQTHSPVSKHSDFFKHRNLIVDKESNSFTDDTLNKEFLTLNSALSQPYQTFEQTTPTEIQDLIKGTLDKTAEDLNGTVKPQKTTAEESLSEKDSQNKRSNKQSLSVKLLLSFISSCFSNVVMMLYYMTISDYVGRAVFGGQPPGQGNEDSAKRYRAGIKLTAWGFIISYFCFMSCSLLQTRLQAALGYKKEFVLIQLLVSGCMTLLVLVSRVEVFLLLAAAAGIHRSCVQFVPFACVNDMMQAEAEKRPKGSDANTGLAMSLVSSTVACSCFIVGLLGPLEDLTGMVTLRLWIGVVSGLVAALFFSLIQIH